jgi:hypothetical protein
MKLSELIERQRNGRGLNQPRHREEIIEYGKPLPFNRRRILAEELRQCEQTLAFTTRWLAEAEWNGAAAVNREHFLDWRWDANDRYARCLLLVQRISP